MWGFLGYPALRFHIGIPRVPSIGVPLEMDGLGLDVGVHGVPSIGVPLEIDGLGLDVGILRFPSIGVPYWDSWGPQYWSSS